MVYVCDCKISIFFQKFTKHSTFNSKDRYVLVFVKISYYHKNMPYVSCCSEPNIMKIEKLVILSFPTSYGYRSVLAKLII